jgi:hypothetical protein
MCAKTPATASTALWTTATEPSRIAHRSHVDRRTTAAHGTQLGRGLAWVETQNAVNYMGHSDWRLPEAKELQSIVDYTRSPDTTASAAIDPVFNATSITNEAGQTDYPYYWSNTTHANWSTMSGTNAAYVAFGRAMGYMNGRVDGCARRGSAAQRPQSG